MNPPDVVSSTISYYYQTEPCDDYIASASIVAPIVGTNASADITILDYTALSGKTILIDGVFFTEGVDWNAEVNNSITATNISISLAVSGISVYQADSSLTVIGNSSTIEVLSNAPNSALSISITAGNDEIDGAAAVISPQSDLTISSIDSATYNFNSITTSSINQLINIGITSAGGPNSVTSTWNSATDVPNANGETYCIYARANDGNTNSTVATITVILDNTAPSSTDFASFTTASTTLTPVWSSATGASTYTVSSTADSAVTTSSLNNPFSSLTPNTAYSFQLKATDSYGNASSYSTATTTYTDPALPITVSAIANGQTAVIVSWGANGNPADTVYEISATGKTTPATQTTTSTKKVFTGLASGGTYTFKVRAISSSGNTSQDTAYTDYTSQITTQAQTQAVTMTLITGDTPASFQYAGSQDTHTAQVTDIQDYDGTLKASLTIHSNTVNVTLGAGESQNVDLNGNGSNDTAVTMSNVSSDQASFILTAISQGSGSIFTNPPTVTNNETKVLSINNGALTTNNSQVKLNFNLSNAQLMAVSNNANFDNTSFENYSITKDWTLTPGNGLKTVYAKFRSADGGTIIYSSQITLIGQSFDDATAQPVSSPEETTPKTNQNNCSLTPNTPYKTSKSKVVYYITNDCTKQIIPNEKYYFTYFNNWNEVKTITETELNKLNTDQNKNTAWGPKYDPKYGALVKTLNDPKVYLLLNDSKYWITSEKVFTALKYSWNWIEQVSKDLLDKYLTKEEINTTTSHPNYTLIKYNNSPKVYRLEPNPTDNTKQVKRHIPNETEFYKLNFRFDRVVTVPDIETYSDGGELKS